MSLQLEILWPKKKSNYDFFFLIIYFIYFIVFYTFSVWPVSSSIWRPLCDPAPQQRLRVRTKDKCGNKELLFEAVTLSAAASVNSINPPNHTHSYAQTPRIGATCTSVSTSFFSFFSKSIENDIKQFRSCLHYRNHTTVPQLYWRP